MQCFFLITQAHADTGSKSLITKSYSFKGNLFTSLKNCQKFNLNIDLKILIPPFFPNSKLSPFNLNRIGKPNSISDEVPLNNTSTSIFVRM